LSKVVYSVHGYGRGHAVRSAAVMRSLQSLGTQISVFSGGDATPMLEEFSPQEIPVMSFSYKGRRLNLRKMAVDNSFLVPNLLLQQGQALRQITSRLCESRPDLVISDSEPLVLAAARRLGIKTCVLDRYTALKYGPDRGLSALDFLEKKASIKAYTALMGHVDYAIGTSFYSTPEELTTKSGTEVSIVGGIVAPDARTIEPSDAGHVLVYANSGREEFLNVVLEAIRESAPDRPVIVYPSKKDEVRGSTTYKRPDRTSFLQDLASSSLLVTTAGNQLLGECRALGKRVLAIPESSMEQKANARHVPVVGLGLSTSLDELERHPEIICEALETSVLPSKRSGLLAASVKLRRIIIRGS